MKLPRLRWFLGGLVATIAASVGLAEAMMRRNAVPPDEHPALIAHPAQGWALRPGEHEAFDTRFSVDAAGWRTHTGAARTPDIVLVGDDPLFGTGLGELQTLGHSLEGALAGSDLPKTVGNLAVPGYTAAQSLAALETWGWHPETRLLVFGGVWSDLESCGFKDAAVLGQDGEPRSVLWATLTDRHPPTMLSRWLGCSGSGASRLSPEEYAATLDRLLDRAFEEEVGVVLLSPCDRQAAALGAGLAGGPSASYLDILDDVARRRALVQVRACEVLWESGLDLDGLFIDDRNPSALANRLLAMHIVRQLKMARWPDRPLLPRP